MASVERDLDFPLKREKKNTKQDSNREKVYKFLPAVLFRRRKAVFFCLKLRLFEIYTLPLRLIKHNLPFFLPPGGVHIARIHGIFLRVETQMLFDLLNDFGCSPRGKSRSGMFEALPNFVVCPSGRYRLSSSGLPRFRLIWALFRSDVPLVTVGGAHEAFSARSLLRSAGRCSLQVAAFLDRLCG